MSATAETEEERKYRLIAALVGTVGEMVGDLGHEGAIAGLRQTIAEIEDFVAAGRCGCAICKP